MEDSEFNLTNPVRVADSQVGKGVFANRSFPINAAIGEITGEIVDDPSFSSDYAFDIGDDILQLNPAPPFRFLNHSCDPNCEYDFFPLDEIPEDVPSNGSPVRAYLFAIRDIQAGEELTIDYNWAAKDAIRCLCDAYNCRGWVVCEEELHKVNHAT